MQLCNKARKLEVKRKKKEKGGNSNEKLFSLFINIQALPGVMYEGIKASSAYF